MGDGEREAVAMIKSFKENAVLAAKAKEMRPEELRGKHVVGVLHEIEKTEFCDEYQLMVDRLKGGQH